MKPAVMILAGTSLALLGYSLYVRYQVKSLVGTLEMATSLIGLSEEIIDELAQQIPGDIELSENLETKIDHFRIMRENDMF